MYSGDNGISAYEPGTRDVKRSRTSDLNLFTCATGVGQSMDGTAGCSQFNGSSNLLWNNSSQMSPFFLLDGQMQLNNCQQLANTRPFHEFPMQLANLARQYGLDINPAVASATVSFMVNQQKFIGANPQAAFFPGAAASAAADCNAVAQPNFNSVLMVANLNEEHASPDALFTLFGVYGDVMRVKVMYNRKSRALVQFATGQQAFIALQHLNGKELWGRPMRIQMSKTGDVQLPKAGMQGDLTKDYSNSKLHRFRKPNSKNHVNIFAPNNVLHLSNMPESLDTQVILDLFQRHGFKVVNFRYMQKDKKMALLELENTDVAMQALIALHNSKIAENANLRLCFSKSGF